MNARRLLFPREARFLPGHRWLNIALRSVHLIGLAGLGAGFLYPAADDTWRMYLHVTAWSGLGLVALFVWSDGVWLVQLRGQAIMLKVGLLGVAIAEPDWQRAMLLLIIVLSGFIAHAPARIRYFSIYHRRQVEHLP